MFRHGTCHSEAAKFERCCLQCNLLACKSSPGIALGHVSVLGLGPSSAWSALTGFATHRVCLQCAYDRAQQAHSITKVPEPFLNSIWVLKKKTSNKQTHIVNGEHLLTQCNGKKFPYFGRNCPEFSAYPCMLGLLRNQVRSQDHSHTSLRLSP